MTSWEWEEARGKMRFLEDLLIIRARETRRLEAELLELSMALTDRTHEAVCDAIDDAMSGWDGHAGGSPGPADPTESANEDRNAAPANLSDSAGGGSNTAAADDEDEYGEYGDWDDDDDDYDLFWGTASHIPIDPIDAGVYPELAVGQTVLNALCGIKEHIGPKGLVKTVIESAVRASHLGAEEVVAAALEVVVEGASHLTLKNVVTASLQAVKNARGSRSTRDLPAREILGSAVAVASSLGNEVPVIIKEAFVAASSKLDSSMLRSCLLSVLGCAMGMGMTSGDIKDLMEAFSREVDLGAISQKAAEGPPKTDRLSEPMETQVTDSVQPQDPQQLQPSLDLRDTAKPPLNDSTDGILMSKVKKDSPEPSAEGDESPMLSQIPKTRLSPQPSLHHMNYARSSAAAAPLSAKRSASEVEYDDDDDARPSKKVKIESDDRKKVKIESDDRKYGGE